MQVPVAQKAVILKGVQAVANDVESRGVFVGGPVADFERVGRVQISTMIREGLYPWSKTLDIGCGILRGGFWLIHFLDTGCYFGIEPNQAMLKTGLEELIPDNTLAVKRPAFDHNDRFDLSVFAVRFDAVLARSVWTHASEAQIRSMLQGFRQNSTDRVFFLASYLPATWPWQDYCGEEFVGRSHKSDMPGLVRHRFGWIRKECQNLGLHVSELPDQPVNDQVWLRISRS